MERRDQRSRRWGAAGGCLKLEYTRGYHDVHSRGDVGEPDWLSSYHRKIDEAVVLQL